MIPAVVFGVSYAFTPIQSRLARGVLSAALARLSRSPWTRSLGRFTANQFRAPYLMFKGNLEGCNPKNWKELVEKKDVIIMIHGSPGRAGLMAPIIQGMREKGMMKNHVVFAKNWETSEGLDAGFERLSKLVKKIRNIRKDAQIHVVGHSWGAILSVLAQVRGLNLSKLHLISGRIAVDGKYNWSEAFFRSCGIFKPELKYIQEIQQKLPKKLPGEITTFRGKHDGLVPFWAQNLGKHVKKDVVFEGVDHLSMLWHTVGQAGIFTSSRS